MTLEEFEARLQKSGLSKGDMAKIFGISRQTIYNWGKTKNIPYWVESWLTQYTAARRNSVNETTVTITVYATRTKGKRKGSEYVVHGALFDGDTAWVDTHHNGVCPIEPPYTVEITVHTYCDGDTTTTRHRKYIGESK